MYLAIITTHELGSKLQALALNTLFYENTDLSNKKNNAFQVST